MACGEALSIPSLIPTLQSNTAVMFLWERTSQGRGKKDADNYSAFLSEILSTLDKVIRLGQRVTFQRDNDLKHNAKKT